MDNMSKLIVVSTLINRISELLCQGIVLPCPFHHCFKMHRKMVIVHLLLIFTSFFSYLVYNTITLKSSPLHSCAARSGDVLKENVAISFLPGDQDRAIKRLSKSIKFNTTSFPDPLKFNISEFEEFHSYLKREFPQVHKKLDLIKVSQDHLSLIYRWHGKHKDKLPILLMAHQDVVGIDERTLKNWDFPPFSGAITEDNYVYGRGTLDVKSMLLAQLEAIELLLSQSYIPESDIYLAYGHDEEVGGLNGAKRVASYFAKSGINFAFIHDEGLVVAENAIPGLSKKLALVGLAEKGFANYILRVSLDGGHASMPKEESAITILSNAIVRLNRCPTKATLTNGLVKELIFSIAPEFSSFFHRLIAGNIAFFEPIILPFISRLPWINSLSRTTISATILESGFSANVIPSEAFAKVNARIMPGESIGSVKEFIEDCIEDNRVSVSVSASEKLSEPSPISTHLSKEFKVFSDTICQTFGDVIVAPGLLFAGTDTSHFTELKLSEKVFRFIPLTLNPQTDTARIHGLNERISIDNYTIPLEFCDANVTEWRILGHANYTFIR